MKKLTQKEIIQRHLKNNPDTWFKSYELGKANLGGYWIGNSGERRARELAEDGLIDVDHTRSKFAEYHFKSSLYKKVQYTLADGRVLNFVEKK